MKDGSVTTQDITISGNATAPTQLASDDSTKLATTAFVKTAVDNLIDSAPGALDTLNELAAAIGDDANYAATVTTALAGKQATIGDGDLTIARTSGLQTALDSKQATLTAGRNINIVGNTISAEADTNMVKLDAVEFTVTVASKTSLHPYYGSGTGSGYFINGSESPIFTFVSG